MNFDSYLVRFTEVSSKWIIDLTIKSKPVKCIGRDLVILDLLAMIPKEGDQSFLRYNTKSNIPPKTN